MNDYREKYALYLQGEEWKEKRRRVLDRDGWKCQICESTENLSVHHMNYDTIFHEDEFWLVTVCPDCHRFMDKHRMENRLFQIDGKIEQRLGDMMFGYKEWWRVETNREIVNGQLGGFLESDQGKAMRERMGYFRTQQALEDLGDF